MYPGIKCRFALAIFNVHLKDDFWGQKSHLRSFYLKKLDIISLIADN
jgi:hypothetical protein